MVIKKRKDKSYTDLIKRLEKAGTEEDVKSAFLRYFELESSTKNRHDTYTPQILFEFKYDINFDNIGQRARVLSQALYYVHELKYSEGKFSSKAVPKNLMLIDKNEIILTPTDIWKEYYDNINYNWLLSPSTPDIQLITNLSRDESVAHMHTYKVFSHTDFALLADKIIEIYSLQQQFDFEKGDKKIITEENFEEVYRYWKEQIFEHVITKTKFSRLFLTDIQKSTIFSKETGEVVFNLGDGKAEILKVQPQQYEYFWSVYDRLKDPFVLKNILTKIDRLTEDKDRRYEGEFYTPIEFANLGLKYLEDTLGKNWYREYKIWDMACGTGNLERSLPADCFENLYLSTLHQDEVDYLSRIFPGANCFQYDYLNDDVDALFSDNQQTLEKYTWKLPKKLREELANPKNKWVVLINPPFVTSQKAGTTGESKKDVSNTKLREYMHKDNLGEVSRELFSQFIYRIQKEIPKTHLGIFSTLKYVNATNDEKFRKSLFSPQFNKGFIFSAENFIGTNGKFPVGFLVWNFGNREQHLQEQNIQVEIFDENVKNIGIKKYPVENKEKFLNNWFERAKNNVIFPPLKSAINIACENKDTRDRFHNEAIGSLMTLGNDVQHQNLTAILSGPCASAGGTPILKENFEKSCVILSVKQIIKKTWMNDRDQFMQPKSKLSDEFILDCILWSLFANSNQTSAMKDVEYKGKIYQIQNHFFPYSISFISEDIANPDLLLGASNRFIYEYILNHKLSSEAQKLYEIGKKVYKIFYKNYSSLNTPKRKIGTWDAGWYQIRMALGEIGYAEQEIKELKEVHKKLCEKILPQIYSYGFLPEEKTLG